ncbi:MAG: hypothetical protein SOT90_08375, partial [Muribaculaceae bacterium]|nr:hypothetical protein [Muribaculaceae bacterium]
LLDDFREGLYPNRAKFQFPCFHNSLFLLRYCKYTTLTAKIKVYNNFFTEYHTEYHPPKKSPFCLKVLPYPFFSLPFSINMNQRLSVWRHINIGTIDTANKQPSTKKKVDSRLDYPKLTLNYL